MQIAVIRAKGRRDRSYYFRAMPFNCYIRNSSFSAYWKSFMAFSPKMAFWNLNGSIRYLLILSANILSLMYSWFHITKNIFKKKVLLRILFHLSLFNKVVLDFHHVEWNQENVYHVSMKGIWLETSCNAVLVTDKARRISRQSKPSYPKYWLLETGKWK